MQNALNLGIVFGPTFLRGAADGVDRMVHDAPSVTGIIQMLINKTPKWFANSPASTVSSRRVCLSVSCVCVWYPPWEGRGYCFVSTSGCDVFFGCVRARVCSVQGTVSGATSSLGTQKLRDLKDSHSREMQHHQQQQLFRRGLDGGDISLDALVTSIAQTCLSMASDDHTLSSDSSLLTCMRSTHSVGSPDPLTTINSDSSGGWKWFSSVPCTR